MQRKSQEVKYFKSIVSDKKSYTLYADEDVKSVQLQLMPENDFIFPKKSGCYHTVRSGCHGDTAKSSHQ
jgi:hypothetical protein